MVLRGKGGRQSRSYLVRLVDEPGPRPLDLTSDSALPRWMQLMVLLLAEKLFASFWCLKLLS